LVEPLGGIIAYLFLSPFISKTILACVFSFVAGSMVFISFDELLPAAHAYDEHHSSLYGLFAVMGIMALSLIFLT